MPFNFLNDLANGLRFALPDTIQEIYTSNVGMAQRFPAQPAEQSSGVLNVVEYDIGTAQTYAVGAGFGAATSPRDDNGNVGWAGYATAIEIPLQAVEQAEHAGTRGLDLLVTRYQRKMQDKIRSLLQLMSGHILTGAGVAAREFEGMATFQVQDAAGANVAGGINRTLFPQWACTIYDNAAAPRDITTAIIEDCLIDHQMTTLGVDGDYDWSGWEIWAGQVQAGRLGAIDLGSHVQVTQSGRKILGSTGVEIAAGSGAPIPVVRVAWPAGAVAVVNTRALRRHSLELGNAKPEFSILDARPAGSDLYRFDIVCHQQIQFENPRHNGFQITDLA